MGSGFTWLGMQCSGGFVYRRQWNSEHWEGEVTFNELDDFGYKLQVCLVMSLCYNLSNVFPNYGRFLLKRPVCACMYVCMYVCLCVLHIRLHGVVTRKTFHSNDHEKSKHHRDRSVLLRLPSKMLCLIFRLSRAPAVLKVCSCYEAAQHSLRRLPVFPSLSVLKNVIARRANGQDRRDR